MSETTKWTKGPWRWVHGNQTTAPLCVIGANGSSVVRSHGISKRMSAEGRANADLIAAAPDLYAALKAEATLLRAWARESREGGWSTHQVDPMLRRADEIDRLLALARGESPSPEEEPRG